MRKKHYLKTIIAFVLAFVFAMPTTIVYAKTYSDVPSSHWAYKQIDYVTDQGYMSGNTQGVFNLEQKIDPFEMAKTLARVAGYESAGTATSVETATQEAIYNKHKSFISQYSNFKLWNSSANREIAYLLEKGILENKDLNGFVIVDQKNQEYIAYPTREKLVVYLVKALDKDSEAKSFTNYNKFNDDSTINASSKCYAYYLRDNNVISGDSRNNFNPKSYVSKAELATILYNVDMNINNVDTDTDTDTEEDVITSVTGTLTKLNTSFKTFDVTKSDGTSTSYVLNADGTVYVDNVIASINDLELGMDVSCIVENSYSVSSIRALSLDGGSTDTDTGTDQDVTGEIPEDTETVTGILVSTNATYGSKEITVKVTSYDKNGNTVTDTESFDVPEYAEIYKNDVKTHISQLSSYDNVTIEVKDGVAYVIKAEDRYHLVEGELLTKGYNGTSYNYSFTMKVEDSEDVVEYTINSETLYTRDGDDDVYFDDLRIGDEITVALEYNKVISIDADSQGKSTVTGVIKEIYINQYTGTILLEETKSGGTYENLYTIRPKDYDIYDLKVKNDVTLTLESNEVTDLEINNATSTVPVTGIIESVSLDEVIVRTVNGYETIEVSFTDTDVINSKTGVVDSLRALDTEMNITAYWNDDTEIASTIIIN
ncbi:MAG: S-layer homology domain-containing protein [Lachnospirales bacterium]